MGMMAEGVDVMRVENGWTVVVRCTGTSLTLVAKSIEEVTGFLKGMEWQTPRPFNCGDILGAPLQPPPASPGWLPYIQMTANQEPRP